MGIFQRIGDVLKSNINDLIDKAEDPEKMVKQIIIDMQQELNKSTQALGKAASSERIAKNNTTTRLDQLQNGKTGLKQPWLPATRNLLKRLLKTKSRQIKTPPHIRKCTILSLSRLKP